MLKWWSQNSRGINGTKQLNLKFAIKLIKYIIKAFVVCILKSLLVNCYLLTQACTLLNINWKYTVFLYLRIKVHVLYKIKDKINNKTKHLFTGNIYKSLRKLKYAILVVQHLKGTARLKELIFTIILVNIFIIMIS